MKKKLKKRNDFLNPDEFLQEIDNLSECNKKIKKINCKDKGNRVELQLSKKLSSYFNKTFSKALGSGSRWSQVDNLPKHARISLTGDICPPEGFKWVIECKGGYESEINLANGLFGRINQLDSFIKQVLHYADFCKKNPILCWKRNHKPWISFIPIELFPEDKFKTIQSKFIYNNWIGTSLDIMLDFPNDFWFE